MFGHKQMIDDGPIYPNACKANPQGEALLK